jgi:hypothetical protein
VAANGNGNGRNGRRPRPDTPPDVAPWERQHGEGDERWEAFIVYRDQLGAGENRRSLAKVGRQLGKSRVLIERWSSEDQWRSRVAAFDREQDALRRQTQAAELAKIVRRQSTSLGAAAQAMLAPIEAYLRRIAQLRQEVGDDEVFKGMTLADLGREAREAARLLPQLVQVERLVNGLTTQNVGGHDGGPISVTVEDARRQAATMDRAALEQLLAGEGAHVN